MTPRMTDALRAVAERVVWFRTPEETLERPAWFLAHVMQHGSLRDVVTAMDAFSPEEFAQALDEAPAGLFTPRSWAFWNLRCGRWPGAQITVFEVGRHRNFVRQVAAEQLNLLRAHGREAAPTERLDQAPDTGQVIDRMRRFDAAVMARLSDRTGWFAAARRNVHELVADAVPLTLLP